MPDLDRASIRVSDRMFHRSLRAGRPNVVASVIASEHTRKVLCRYAAILKAQRDKARADCDALGADIDALMGANVQMCDHCGERPAACFGAYEGVEEGSFACDVCCGHGNEDGWCEPVGEANDG